MLAAATADEDDETHGPKHCSCQLVAATTSRLAAAEPVSIGRLAGCHVDGDSVDGFAALLRWRWAWLGVVQSPREVSMSAEKLLPFQPLTMTSAQITAVSYLARYSGHTHDLYAHQLQRWFAWCETNALDPLVGIQRAHVELFIRHSARPG
ncbi:hypothetical protein [Angustibacter luteus]|uniref:Core-binding (CB) domain-containing protein n=1 Tax=Angustibacter luteus TaxID=658456 RepID=A0ABW1JCD1_9ACTN